MMMESGTPKADDGKKVISPSEDLMEIISPLLVGGKLLLSEDAAKLKSKIAAGTIKAEDWLLAVEKAIAKDVPQ